MTGTFLPSLATTRIVTWCLFWTLYVVYRPVWCFCAPPHVRYALVRYCGVRYCAVPSCGVPHTRLGTSTHPTGLRWMRCLNPCFATIPPPISECGSYAQRAASFGVPCLAPHSTSFSRSRRHVCGRLPRDVRALVAVGDIFCPCPKIARIRRGWQVKPCPTSLVSPSFAAHSQWCVTQSLSFVAVSLSCGVVCTGTFTLCRTAHRTPSYLWLHARVLWYWRLTAQSCHMLVDQGSKAETSVVPTGASCVRSATLVTR